MAETLASLLDRCRRGQPDAAEDLVRRFRRHAAELAEAILQDGHAAEDALQEAFMAALRHLDDLRDPRAFPAYLRQIVRTQAHRILRRRREDLREADPDVPADGPSPLEQLQRDELRRRVRRALASLPPAGRRTAELFYLDELNQHDVAERLNVPTGTVKRRLHEVRAALRNMLLGCVADEPPRRGQRQAPGAPTPPEEPRDDR